jgi:hypothetical protein
MSTTFIIEQLLALPGVSNVTELQPGLLDVQRDGKPPIRVAVSDERSVDIDNVAQVLERWPNVNAVVVAGKDRHVYGDARRYGQDRNVTVMVLRDFMGALSHGQEGQWASYEQQWKRYARESLMQHPKVDSVEYDCESVLLVKRAKLGDVRVVPVDIYTLGAADFFKIRSGHPQIDAILNASNYRSITRGAVERGAELGIGVFDLTGIYKALYRDRANFASSGN